MKHVTIHTDGAAKGNPGPGGFGVLLTHQTTTRELSGGYSRTTNNRMGLLAAIPSPSTPIPDTSSTP